MHSYAAEIEERASHGRMVVCARLLLEQQASFPRPLQLTRRPFPESRDELEATGRVNTVELLVFTAELGLQFAPDHRARTGNRLVRRPMPSRAFHVRGAVCTPSRAPLCCVLSLVRPGFVS